MATFWIASAAPNNGVRSLMMVDEPSERIRILELLPARAPIPALTGAVVEDVLNVAKAWEAAASHAAVHRREADLTDEAIHRSDLDDADSRFGPEFRARAASVFVAASTTGTLPEWEERIEDLFSCLRAIQSADEYWYVESPTRLSKEEVDRRTWAPFKLRDIFNELVSRLQVVGDSLPRTKATPRPLADVELRVFNILNGEALLAKDIARRLDPPSSTETVRATIERIRKKGHEIEEIRLRGYFRPDAPPPDVAPRLGTEGEAHV